MAPAARHSLSAPFRPRLAVWCLLFLTASVSSTVFFEENFTEGNDSLNSWILPAAPEKPQGKFVVSHKKYLNDTSVMGLKTTEDYRFYVISRRFKTPASTKNDDLIVQLSVSFEQNIDCGGGYIKLFGSKTDQSKLTDTTPYHIMFGPDICGYNTKKVHAILNHNDTNHNLLSSPKCSDDVFTHVYTLILRASNRSYDILIDNKVVQSGNLSTDWGILKPREISDPNDKKPSDWDDREYIDDPKEKKPEDWDKPEFIEDKAAVKPEDWDEDADGAWAPPMKSNPEFKGEWKPKKIKNDDYKGVWKAQNIPNPDFVDDDSIGVFDDIAVVGIDVWQVKSGTIFSDFLITDDAELARKNAEEIIAKTKHEKETKETMDKEEMNNMDTKDDKIDEDKIDDDIDDKEDGEEETEDSETKNTDEDKKIHATKPKIVEVEKDADADLTTAIPIESATEDESDISEEIVETDHPNRRHEEL